MKLCDSQEEQSSKGREILTFSSNGSNSKNPGSYISHNAPRQHLSLNPPLLLTLKNSLQRHRRYNTTVFTLLPLMSYWPKNSPTASCLWYFFRLELHDGDVSYIFIFTYVCPQLLETHINHSPRFITNCESLVYHQSDKFSHFEKAHPVIHVFWKPSIWANVFEIWRTGIIYPH